MLTIISMKMRMAATGSVCNHLIVVVAMSIAMGMFVSVKTGMAVGRAVGMNMLMLMEMSLVMGMLVPMHMGVGMASAGVTMLMLIEMSLVMTVLMLMVVGMTGAAGMNMFMPMPMPMPMKARPARGMVMIVAGMAVMRAGVNMSMIVMVPGVRLDSKQGRFGAVATSAMSAHQATSSSSSMVLISSSSPATRSIWREPHPHGV